MDKNLTKLSFFINVYAISTHALENWHKNILIMSFSFVDDVI